MKIKWKSVVLLLGVLLLQGSDSGAAESSGAGAVARVYSASCRYESPLDTYESCNESSRPGVRAAECAYKQALQSCHGQFNVDCVEGGASYHTYISHEFLGYRACEVTVVVRGYRLP